MSTQALVQSISILSLPKIKPVKLSVIGLLLMAGLIVFYVFQVGELTRAGFLVSRQESQLETLLQENKELVAGLSRENSLANTEEALKELNYQQVTKIHYLKAGQGQVAVMPITSQ
jgi:uncharacterized protein HemX